MDLIKLKYFRTAANTLNVRRSAELLKVSPATISNTVKQLENEFGGALFISSNKGMALTDRGQRLYELCDGLLSSYDQLKKKFDAKSLPETHLRIGSYCFFSSYLLEELLPRNLPNVPIYLKRTPPGELEQNLLSKKIDVGITYIPFPNKELEYLKAGTFGMDLYAVSKKFDGRPIAEIPFVSSVGEVENSAYDLRTLDGWPYHTLQRTIKYRVAGLDSAISVCRQGLAALYCPTFVARIHNSLVKESFHLIPVRPSEELKATRHTVFVARRKSDPEDRTLKKITASLRTVCK